MGTIELDLNAVWIVGVIFITVLLLTIIIFALRSKPSHIANVQLMLTDKDCQIYKQQSSAVHPNNTSLCKNMQIDAVVKLGIKKMEEEDYDLLKGVDVNGLSS